eukprot:5409314-Amphidinium_carterae.1
MNTEQDGIGKRTPESPEEDKWWTPEAEASETPSVQAKEKFSAPEVHNWTWHIGVVCKDDSCQVYVVSTRWHSKRHNMQVQRGRGTTGELTESIKLGRWTKARKKNGQKGRKYTELMCATCFSMNWEDKDTCRSCSNSLSTGYR